MAKKKYSYYTVNLPHNIATQIQDILDSQTTHYRNIPDFVRGAVSKLVDEYKRKSEASDDKILKKLEPSRKKLNVVEKTKGSPLLNIKTAFAQGLITVEEYLELKEMAEK